MAGVAGDGEPAEPALQAAESAPQQSKAAPPPQRIRISDADRERVLSELTERYAEGRLSSDTFMGRMDATLAARYHEELHLQLAELPHRWRLSDVARTAAARMTARARSLGSAVSATRAARSGRPGRAAAPPPQQRIFELVLPVGLQPGFTIGRDLRCDFTVPDLSVSRWHARLHKEEDGWRISDLGSTNGTRLNGWRVTTSVPVAPGDSVSLGSVTFVITDRPIAARISRAEP